MLKTNRSSTSFVEFYFQSFFFTSRSTFELLPFKPNLPKIRYCKYSYKPVTRFLDQIVTVKSLFYSDKYDFVQSKCITIK